MEYLYIYPCLDRFFTLSWHLLHSLCYYTEPRGTEIGYQFFANQFHRCHPFIMFAWTIWYMCMKPPADEHIYVACTYWRMLHKYVRLLNPIIKHFFFYIFSYLPPQNTHILWMCQQRWWWKPPLLHRNLTHLLLPAHTGLDIRGFMVPNMVGRGRLDVHGIDIKFMCNLIGSLCGRYQTGYISQHNVYKAS